MNSERPERVYSREKTESEIWSYLEFFVCDQASTAHAVKLMRPAAVIVTHVNEAATSDGKLKPNSRTAAFIKLSKRPVHLAISGRTMEFDGTGKCVAGC